MATQETLTGAVSKSTRKSYTREFKLQVIILECSVGLVNYALFFFIAIMRILLKSHFFNQSTIKQSTLLQKITVKSQERFFMLDMKAKYASML